MFYRSEKEKKYVVIIEWHEKTVSGEKLVDGQTIGRYLLSSMHCCYIHLVVEKDIYVSY
jgi:hypothetical protein